MELWERKSEKLLGLVMKGHECHSEPQSIVILGGTGPNSATMKSTHGWEGGWVKSAVTCEALR
jgi:hypothetical protein